LSLFIYNPIMPETVSVDLVNLLLFTMPGFFFLRGVSYKSNSDLTYFVYSMFWGILLMMLFYGLLPAERFIPLLENPYAGAVILSILSGLLGIVIRSIKEKIKLPIEF